MQTPLPQDFVRMAGELLGAEHAARYLDALREEPSCSLRLNPSKAAPAGLALHDVSAFDGVVPWAQQACYLAARPPFTADPLLHAGVYYVQEAASMFLTQALVQYVRQPVCALDLCAAPGGKSTLLRALLPEGSVLVSNEPVKARAWVLAENMQKWGHPDTVVTRSYPDAFTPLRHTFDLVVTDVPCSGEGMFRKEEDALTGWSLEAVAACAERQRAIVQAVWPCLKPGGLLVYSTCTLNAQENEENVRWIAGELGAEVLPVHCDSSWGVLGDLTGGHLPVSHLVQGFARGEGFFMAVLRKDVAVDADEAPLHSRASRPKGRKGGRESVPVVPAVCKSWVAEPASYDFSCEGDTWWAVRRPFGTLVERLRQHVEVLSAGVPVATLKGKEWIPAHGLALSLGRCADAFPCAALDYGQAVAYLRKESLVLPAPVPKGYVLVTYCGVPLGFVKNLGARANNAYPQEWKIRSGFLQDYSLKFLCAHQ